MARVSFFVTDTGRLTTNYNWQSTESIGWIDSPSKLEEAVGRVKDVRALGLDVGVDFHGRLHKGMAKQLAKLLEPHQPLFIEGISYGRERLNLLTRTLAHLEPLLPAQPEEIADLKQLVATPIALGERLYNRADFRPYFERRAIDIAQPDVSLYKLRE